MKKLFVFLLVLFLVFLSDNALAANYFIEITSPLGRERIISNNPITFSFGDGNYTSDEIWININTPIVRTSPVFILANHDIIQRGTSNILFAKNYPPPPPPPPPDPPSPPLLPQPFTLLGSSDGVGNISLSWTQSQNAIRYDVIRNNVVIANDITSLSHAYNAGTITTENVYQIRAENAEGSILSNTINLVPFIQQPEGGGLASWILSGVSGIPSFLYQQVLLILPIALLVLSAILLVPLLVRLIRLFV